MPQSTSIGAYRILRLINTGGQGSVYLGYDSRLHRRVAIKIYTLPKDKPGRATVLAEARVIAAIQNPRIVQVYDIVVGGDHIALVMEYVEGCDLEELLAGQLPSLPSFLAICTDIAAALAVLRQQHIVHGDLKASNILITSRGRVKLTDFGIASSGSARTVLSSGGAASIASVSPEQYLGQPLDVRSDLFALGALMYRMLTGYHPFVRQGMLDVDALLAADYPPLDAPPGESRFLPAVLVELVDHLLRPVPDQRPRNTHQVRSALRMISREFPLMAGHSLLSEAQGYFRPESPQDLPPAIPADLSRRGRSGLGRRWLGSLSAVQGGALVLGAGVVLAGLWAAGLFSPRREVVVTEPVFDISTPASLPAELSPHRLASEVARALQAHSIVANSPGLPDTYYSNTLAPGLVDDPTAHLPRIHTEVHCVDQLCLLGLELDAGDESYLEQKMVFASAPMSRWDTLVRSATHALLARAR